MQCSSKNKAVQQWLSRYASAMQKAEILEQRLSHLELSAPDGSGTERVRRQLEEAKRNHVHLLGEVDSAISQGVHTEFGKAVLQMRYLDGMSWNDITAAAFGGKVDFLEKEASYLRRVMLTQSKALEELSSFLDLQEAPESRHGGG